MSDKENLKKQFGQQFTQIIEDRCINVSALARKTGLHMNSIVGYMAGRNLPNKRSAKKLNEFFAQEPPTIPYLEGRDK